MVSPHSSSCSRRDGEPPKDLASLVRASPGTITRRASQSLAITRHVNAAVKLGAPLISKMAAAQRSAAWLEIGNWQAAREDIAGASLLDQAIATSLPSVCWVRSRSSQRSGRGTCDRAWERAEVAESILATPIEARAVRLRRGRQPG